MPGSTLLWGASNQQTLQLYQQIYPVEIQVIRALLIKAKGGASKLVRLMKSLQNSLHSSQPRVADESEWWQHHKLSGGKYNIYDKA